MLLSPFLLHLKLLFTDVMKPSITPGWRRAWLPFPFLSLLWRRFNFALRWQPAGIKLPLRHLFPISSREAHPVTEHSCSGYSTSDRSVIRKLGIVPCAQDFFMPRSVLGSSYRPKNFPTILMVLTLTFTIFLSIW